MSRCVSKGLDNESELLFDYNTDLFSLNTNTVLNLNISKTHPSDFNKYDYIMSGKVFKVEDLSSKFSVTSSFGGLLARITLDKAKIFNNVLNVGDDIFFCLKKRG